MTKNQHLGAPICFYTELQVSTFSATDADDQPHQQQQVLPRQEVTVVDLTSKIQDLVVRNGLQNGQVTIVSRHTTTSLVMNEYEKRLIDDIKHTFLSLIPPDDRSVASTTTTPTTSTTTTTATTTIRYKHNDIELRPDSDAEVQRCLDNGWNIYDQEELRRWRDQEPINAHSHLLAMCVGSQTVCLPVIDRKLMIGKWQSVMLLDLDGPRSDRTVGVQLMGYQ
jgi:thiamine phosphate synthase YjbQ (UPF0047 family)